MSQLRMIYLLLISYSFEIVPYLGLIEDMDIMQIIGIAVD